MKKAVAHLIPFMEEEHLANNVKGEEEEVRKKGHWEKLSLIHI